jgi:hypothetical protein
MKKFILTLLTAAFLLPITHAYALSDIESLAVFQASMKKNAADIWPGFSIGNRPMIVATRSDDSLYAFDLMTQNVKWEKKILQGVPVNYMQHDSVGAHAFLNNNKDLNKFFMLENKPTTVMGLWSEDSDFNISEMSFEYYLNYELHDSPYAKTKLDILNQIIHGEQIHFDSFNNPEIYSLLYVEVAVLKEYLSTQNAELLKTFAAVHQYRTQLLNANAKQYEISRDFPLCFYYVYMKALEISGVDSAKIILDKYLNKLPCYLSKSGDGDSCFPIIPDDFDEEYDDMLRVIYMTEQYALDKLVPDWKNTVESKNTPPTTILLQHYSLSNSEAKSLTEAAKARYGYAEFIQNINEKLQPYLMEMKQLQIRYENQAGVEFILKNQAGANGGRVSTYAKEYKIDNLTTIATESESLEVDDYNVDFKAENMPMYGMADEYFLKFKITPDTLITLDSNKPITIAEFIQANKPVKVSQISMSGQGDKPFSATLKMTKTAGVLSVVNGKIELNYKS